ncbi:MAG: hypothetical protein KH009_02830 [Clostridiales bacterium]|nr:hypothetical protein [Clostridiales bacterium]
MKRHIHITAALCIALLLLLSGCGRNNTLTLPVPEETDRLWLLDCYDSLLLHQEVEENSPLFRRETIRTITAWNDLPGEWWITVELDAPQELSNWCADSRTPGQGGEPDGLCFALQLQQEGEVLRLVRLYQAGEELPEPLSAVALYDRGLEQSIIGAEPLWELPVSRPYPQLIGELFNRLITEINESNPPEDALPDCTITELKLWGDAEEFAVTYTFSGRCASEPPLADASASADGSFTGATQSVRARRLEDGSYAVTARGGGPLTYGLSPSRLDTDALLREIGRDSSAPG